MFVTLNSKYAIFTFQYFFIDHIFQPTYITIITGQDVGYIKYLLQVVVL